MKKIRNITLMVVMVLSVVKGVSYSMFDAPYWGVRAYGMGTAFTAVSDDVNATVYNIAGLGNIEKAEISAMSSKLLTGLEGFDGGASFIGFAVPINDEIGAIGGSWDRFAVTGLMTEDIFSIGYGRSLYDLIDAEWLDISLGLNFKYITHSIEGTSPNGYINASKGAFSIDFGAMARFENGISIGFSSKYLNKPDVSFGLAKDEYGEKMKDPVKNTNTLGLAYYTEELPVIKLPYFTVAADYEMRDGENNFAVGAETRIIDGSLAIRTGGWKEQINFGLGYALELGEGEKTSYIMIDYAFGLPLSNVVETSGDHYLGLSYRFY